LKKKAWIRIIVVLLLLAILVTPIPTGVYKDGGTRVYSALTYKIVDWNRLTLTGIYDETRVYFFPNNFKSLDRLLEMEEDRIQNRFLANVVALEGSTVLVEALADQPIRQTGTDLYRFGIRELEDIGVQEGDCVQITFIGAIRETYPAQIDVVAWELVKDLRFRTYEGQWLDKEKAGQKNNNLFSDVVITEIYANCFFAHSVIPMPYEIKINGSLGEEWCVGDQVLVTYENTWYDEESWHVEADLVSVTESDFRLQPGVAYKPVIYLYPEIETAVSVRLLLDGKLTCTYPAYKGGWKVTAAPDGTLTDGKGQTYNYLYWEGETETRWDMTRGFCVKGEDTAVFLEQALEKLGLTRREANEFIVYWLPLMEGNPYNIISFQMDLYTDAARLEIDPVPDTLIRVFMAWKATDCFVDLPAQELTAPPRTGFTVVEWGGTQVQ
jgi:hypothetical protein